MAIKTFDLELISAKMITPHVKHLVLKRADGEAFEFTAGQFITFLFDCSEAKPKRRSYSIATIPATDNTNEIEIAISYVEGGIATRNLFDMQPGDCFSATGPAGRLVLRDEPVKRLILVGTGTGIAPYRAMLPELADKVEKENIQVEVLLGVQYRKDALYSEDFLQFSQSYENINFTACLSREKEDLETHEHQGYVQSQFEMLNLNPQEDIIYLCGNPNMIDQAYELLKEKGFDIKNVRREKYISSN
ncbi:ferredoxin--NADP reductase [Thiotrichales bacterium 19S3-7]|nr:ferredoxin--NADP reductase [Thiotrichales bacterium 19S3-7]MCF6802340.1 ferredoxin--NADP reductase [Thiotrichales bacterium 19S3-11]